MNQSQEYQKQLTQLQSLKKHLTSQKLSHQTTIDQLQTSYNLNRQLQQIIKTQTNTINQLHRQLSQKNNRLSQISQTYETQLLELKEFINVKERQLQGIRGSLVVTDYDMIRLRVISQLELVHKEQVDQLNRQIQKVTKLWNLQKQAKEIVQEKYRHIKSEIQNIRDKYQQEKEDIQRKNIREINKYNDKLELERMTRKDLEKQLQKITKKYQQLHEKYQQQFNNKYNQFNSQTRSKSVLQKQQHSSSSHHNTYHSHSHQADLTILNLKQANQQKTEQIQSLKRKLQKQSSKFIQIINQNQNKLKQVKNSYIQYEEHTKLIRQKEKQFEETIKGYQKKLKNIRQDHGDELRRINKENDGKLEELRERFGRLQKQREKENYMGNGKEYQSSRDISETIQQRKKNTQKQKRLQQKIKALQQQNWNLHTKISQPNNYNKTTQTIIRGNLTNLKSNTTVIQETFKNKLEQANQQIVSLLLEKVTLKKQINRLKC